MSSTGTPTPHLGLNQWLPNDKPERVDFDGDNLKIDAAYSSIMHQLPSETYTVNMADLQTLINGLPKLLTKNITINVNAGTLNGTLTIENFHGLGILTIIGATTIGAETHLCTNVVMSHCRVFVQVNGITATATSGIAWEVEICNVVFLVNNNAPAGNNSTASFIGIACRATSAVYIANNVISNKNIGIRSNLSNVTVYGLQGVNNSIVYYVYYSGRIYIANIGTISGTTFLSENLGGQVILPATYGTNNDNSVAYGKGTMAANYGRSYNTAIGYNALNKNGTDYNTAIGSRTLMETVTGAYNTAVGHAALQNTTASYNTAVGNQAGLNNTTGTCNVAIGHQASFSNTTGYNNVAIGMTALSANITGNQNIAIGKGTLYNNTAENNVAVGYSTLTSNTTGRENASLGTVAGVGNTTGSFNVFLGSAAGYANTTGSNNIFLGYGAGRYLSDGSTAHATVNTSVFIGSGSKGASSDSQSNQIVIGYNAIGYGSNTAHIGNTSVASISYGAATGTAFTNRSDPRIKEDIQDADLDTCVDSVKNLPLHYFKYKDFVGNEGDQHVLGFLSTEFSEVLPKAVHRNTMTFDERDEDGNVIYETKIVDEYVDEEVEVEVKTLKEIIDPDTGDTLIITRIKTQTEMRPILKQIEKEVPKQIIIEDCESIDSSQLVPILWGAVQQLVAKVEKLEARINE